MVAALTEPLSAPAATVAATARMAAMFALGEAAGNGVVSPPVATLAQGRLQAISMAKLKSAVALVIVLGLFVAGVGLTASHFLALKPPETATVASEQPKRPKTEKAERTDLYGDPLPPGAVARLGTRRLIGPSEPRWVGISPDGTKVASQSWNGVTVWDAATGRLLVEREAYRAREGAVGWRKDGTGVALVRLPDWSYFVSAFTDPIERLPNPLPAAGPPATPTQHKYPAVLTSSTSLHCHRMRPE